MTFLITDSMRHWLRISNLFSKHIKVKGCQWLQCEENKPDTRPSNILNKTKPIGSHSK